MPQWLRVGACVVGLVVAVAAGTQIGSDQSRCPPDPTAELLAGFDQPVDDVTVQETSGCALRVIVEARDEEGPDVQTALAEHLEREGVSMSEQGLGWRGTLAVGEREYAVSLTHSPGDAGAFAAAWDTVELSLTPQRLASGLANPTAPGQAMSELVAAYEPRVVDDVVLALAGDRMAGFDSSDGAPVWSGVPCEWPTWPGPVQGPATQNQVVRCGDRFTGFDRATGDVRWEYPNSESFDHVRVGPRVMVLQSAAVVRVIDLGTGDERWSVDDFGDASVSSDEDRVFIGNDARTVALDIDTGEEVWSKSIGSSGLLAAPGTLVIRPRSHDVRRLDPATGAALWRSPPDDDGLDFSEVMGFTADAAILFSPRADQVSAYDLEDGSRRWSRRHVDFVSVGPRHAVVADSRTGVATIVDARTGEAVLEPAGVIASDVALGAGRYAVVEHDVAGVRLVVEELP